MTIVTVDMDDTLIRTSQDYTNASEQFGAFVAHEYGVDADRAVERQNEIDYRLLDEEGLSADRYPKSFELALRDLVDNPPETHIEHAREIGENTFKSRAEYADRGFMPGTREMLDCLRAHTENLHLVTVGDPEIQERKIDALSLENWFDSVHIPSFEEGKAAVFSDLLNTHSFDPSRFVHIGNSASSDVEPAIEVGGSSVYISDDTDWLSDDDTHHEMVNHDAVHPYEDAHQFVPEIPSVIKGETNYSTMNDRQV